MKIVCTGAVLLAAAGVAVTGCEPPREAAPVAASATETPAPVPLPPGWTGAGVLADANDRPPHDAPDWAAHAAQVVQRDGTRWLLGTGRADDIDNAGLARRTAENRARAQLARWLRQERLVGAEVIHFWNSGNGRVHIAQVQIAISNSVLAAPP